MVGREAARSAKQGTRDGRAQPELGNESSVFVKIKNFD